MELRIHLASHDAELRVCSTRAYTIAVSLSFDVCSFVGGALSPHTNSSKQPQSQLNLFAVAVVVTALGRSLYFLSFPADASLLSAASTEIISSDQQPNPSTAST